MPRFFSFNFGGRISAPFFLMSLFLLESLVWAVSGGSLAGTITDQSGAVVPYAKLRIVNDALRTEFKASVNSSTLAALSYCRGRWATSAPWNYC